VSLLYGANEDGGVGDSDGGGFFNGTSWRLVSLCSVSGGRRRRFKEDGSKSSFFDIADDCCFRFGYQLHEPGWCCFPLFLVVYFPFGVF
jgi:hypothetical protein